MTRFWWVGILAVGVLLGVGALAGAATAGHGSAPGDVVYVNGSYSGTEDGTELAPFDTIQEGVGHASAGDTVVVEPTAPGDGPYDETVAVDESVRLVADGRVVLDGGGRTGAAFDVTANRTGVAVEGFTIRNYAGGAPGAAAGVRVAGNATDLAIRNLTLERLNGTAVYVAAAAGPNANVSVRDNTVRGVDSRGIVLGSVENASIAGNEIVGSTDPLGAGRDTSSAIAVVADAGGAERVRITDNAVTGSIDENAIVVGGHGYRLEGVRVANNTVGGVVDPRGGGLLLYAYDDGAATPALLRDVAVADNEVGERAAGVRVLALDAAVENVSVHRNAIEAPASVGIGLAGEGAGRFERVRVVENDVADAGSAGVSVLARENATVAEALVADNAVAGGGDGIIVRAADDGTVRTVGVVTNSVANATGEGVALVADAGTAGGANASNVTVAGNEVDNASAAGVEVRAEDGGAVAGSHVDATRVDASADGVAVRARTGGSVAGLNVSRLDAADGEDGVDVAARADSTVSNLTLTRLRINRTAGAALRIGARGTGATVSNVTVSEALVEASERGLSVVADDGAVTGLAVRRALFDATDRTGFAVRAAGAGAVDGVTVDRAGLRNGSGSGLLLRSADAAAVANVTIRRALVTDNDDLGLGVVGTGESTVERVRVRRTLLGDNSVGLYLNESGNATHAGISVRESLIENNSAGVLATAATGLGDTGIHRSFVAGNGAGVVNRNDSAVLNATLNYWGNSTGPGSPDPAAPLADPATGDPADGTGDTVSEGASAGVSNVRFDPAVGGQTGCRDGQLVNATGGFRVRLTVQGRTVAGPAGDFVGACVWTRSPLPLRINASEAATAVPNLQVFLSTGDGDVGVNKPYVGVHEVGTPVSLSFADVTGAKTDRFAGERAQLVVLRSEDGGGAGADLADFDVDADAGTVDLGSSAASVVAVRDVGRLDGDGDLSGVEFTPTAAGRYVFLLATVEDGDGFEATGDGNVSVGLFNDSVTIVGVDAAPVQTARSTVATQSGTVAAGDDVTATVAAGFDAANVTHAVAVYDEATYIDQEAYVASNGTVEWSFAGFEGVSRVDGRATLFGRSLAGGRVAGTFGLSGLIERVANGTPVGGAEDVVLADTLVDGSATVVAGRPADDTVAVETLANFSAGTYRVVHVAVAANGDAVATDATTVEIAASGAAAPAPAVGVSPSELAFGTVKEGNNATRSVTVANDGDAPLHVDGTAVVGANASQFAVTAGGGSAVLAPGATRTVNVSFRPAGDGARNATLAVRSNDTATPNATVALSGVSDAPPPVVVGGGGGGGGAPPGGTPPDDGESPEGDPPDGEPEPSVCICGEGPTVTVEVENARAGEPVAIDFTGTDLAGTSADVRLTGLTVTLTEDADFTLEVSKNRSGPGPTPGDGTTFGYLRIDHEVPDAAIRDVQFAFDVKAERLAAAGVDPSNVTLYRYHGGEWADVGAVRSGGSPGYVRYRAVSPGLSAFAVGETGLANDTTTTTTTTATATTTTSDPPEQAGGFDLWPILLLLLLVGVGSGGYYAWREGHLDEYLQDWDGPGGRD